eukprot:3608406-Alexandrium_andersonii.AAC.1
MHGLERNAPATFFVATGASPWGMAGVPQGAPRFLSYWFGQLHPKGLNRFKSQAGGPQFNALREALAMLARRQ